MTIYQSLIGIYKPKYVILNIAIAFIYYYLITVLLSIQQQGVPITSVNVSLIYILAATASVTLTIAIYSVRNTRRNAAKLSATTVSTASAVVGGVLAGCSCQAAILFSALALFINAGEAASLNALISGYGNVLYIAMIIINLSVIIYYLDKLSKPACRIK